MIKPKLILIGGAPGVGKSTLAKALSLSLPNNVRLDGDDLWRMNPFIVNDDTKQMVLGNISYVLRSYLKGAFEHIIFSWVMHEPCIAEQVTSSLDTDDYHLIHITLSCSEDELLRRISGANTKRESKFALDRLATSVAEYPDALDTTSMSPDQVFEHVHTLICEGDIKHVQRALFQSTSVLDS